MMNYITQILAFQNLVQAKQLSTGQIALYYTLLYLNNRCTWIDWFTVPNLSLELNSGLSRSGILKNRNILKQYNLIDFKLNGTRATLYKLIDLSDIAESKQVGKHSSKQVGKHSSKHSSNTLGKQNKTKLIIKENIKEKGEDIFLDYADEDLELLEALNDFVKMRIAIKKPLTTDRAKNMLIKELNKLSNGDNALKINILEQSIFKNWQGIFAIKEVYDYGATRQDTSGQGGKFDGIDSSKWGN